MVCGSGAATAGFRILLGVYCPRPLMTDRSPEDNRTIIELSPTAREQRDITAADVRDALLDLIQTGTAADKQIEDCTFPELRLDYRTLESTNTHPVVFRNCTFPDGVHAVNTDITPPVRFENCTIAGLDVDNARFEDDLTVRDSDCTGEVTGFEARFDRDADFTGTTFGAPVTLDEATFADDTRFERTTFEAAASFRGATFAGHSNELDDNASFDQALFDAPATFEHASFGSMSATDGRFTDTVQFSGTQFTGDAEFSGSVFQGETIFDETRFKEDGAFTACVFHQQAQFRGATFEGGARTLKDDANFEDTTFHGGAVFRAAQFRYANFTQARFEAETDFEAVQFDADAEFTGTTFSTPVAFDEVYVSGDADFSTAHFEREATFRGAFFAGKGRHHDASAIFEDVSFVTDVDFRNAVFTSANFDGTHFGGVAEFTRAEFTDDFTFRADATSEYAYVDFTDAILKEGRITQPRDVWIRYDFTQASLGDVELTAEQPGGQREILDYFRFCVTEFNEFDGYEFDFSAHTYYFDRNNWNLHEFDDGGIERDYALALSPQNIETTYLKAKKAASAGGYIKAAGEFRVRRQRYARRKHVALATDRTADVRTRVTSASRAVENFFLDASCGYGMRLGRILVVFLLAPLLPALLFAFGGPPFRTAAGQLSSLGELTTAAGQTTLFENVYFSYITFLTIGYGDIGPIGPVARIIAGLEVYLSVILGGLVLYALIKRSEL